MINDNYQLIFVHLEKTAGTSIESVLPESHILHSNTKYDGGLTKHFNATIMRNIAGEERWNKYFKFTVIRNPWDRLVSKWFWRKEGLTKKGASANELKSKFLVLDKNGHIPLKWFELEIQEECTRWCLDPSNPEDFLFADGIVFDKMLKFETLKHDWNDMITSHATHFDIKKKELPHLNKTSDKNYKDFYNNETKDFVAKIFEKTIKYGDYSF